MAGASRHACAELYWSAAPADDAVHENAGAISHRRRYATAQVIVPADSREMVEVAFRRRFRGGVAVTVLSGESATDASRRYLPRRATTQR
jgi:hypothetical protein